uniref:Phospholipase A2-like central domain-containing protein n=1 Tax=Anopheles maculatus TaxID=74869 RepID=A0A182SF13_9DIPT
MVRSYIILLSTVLATVCEFVSSKLTTVPNGNPGDSARAFYRSLDDNGYSPTLALILQDYILINSTGTIAWSNPAFVYYDQQLIEAIQQQLEAESAQDPYDQQHQLQADHGSSLLPLYGGLKFLTYYCGPGNWSADGSTVQNAYFSSIDQCCKQHDECPDTIVERRDYRRYEDLPYKPQIFTRNDGLFTADRCLTYMVDNSNVKRWQWFDIPYLSSNQFIFPEVEYRYELDWFNILFDRKLPSKP